MNLFSKISVPFAVLLWVTVLPVSAATFYVDAAAPNDTADGRSSSNAKKYIRSGMALMSTSGGDTLIIANGVYSNALDAIGGSSVHSGTAGQENIIQAQTDGGVVIMQGFDLPSSSSYLRFEGLKWNTTGTTAGKSIKGQHIKFLRCAFRGGPDNGNNVNLSIGTNDVTPGAQHILIEDSWAYGLGGRYNIIVYNSDKVILRRVVVRHDGGWGAAGHGGNPEAGITVYNSSDTLLQNAVVLDSDLTTYAYWEAAFYNVGNFSSTNVHGNGVIAGSIAFNNPRGNSYGYDDGKAIVNARIEDSVAWSNGAGLAIGGSTHNVTARGLTMGMNSGPAFAVWSTGGVLGVTNSIVYANTGNAFHTAGITHSYNNCFNNTSNCSATGETTYDPRTNGLRYPIRIEDGSTLKTAGQSGAQVGAQIVYRIGVSGTLFGEAGYNQTTSQNLWPWPYEARIKTDMSEVSTRGFCAASQTLTNYIWSTLGNSMPGIPLPTPTGLTVIRAP